jgi:hypothetical protein
MKRFKSAGRAQRFSSAHDQINNLFHLRRNHDTADRRRCGMAVRHPELTVCVVSTSIRQVEGTSRTDLITPRDGHHPAHTADP